MPVWSAWLSERRAVSCGLVAALLAPDRDVLWRRRHHESAAADSVQGGVAGGSTSHGRRDPGAFSRAPGPVIVAPVCNRCGAHWRRAVWPQVHRAARCGARQIVSRCSACARCVGLECKCRHTANTLRSVRRCSALWSRFDKHQFTFDSIRFDSIRCGVHVDHRPLDDIYSLKEAERESVYVAAVQ
jgi:hypothetical protein